VKQRLTARQAVRALVGLHPGLAGKMQNVPQPKVPGRAIWMGDHPVRLAVRGRSGTVGGKEHGEQERPKPWQLLRRSVQRGFKGRDRQMGEDPPGDGQRDPLGDAGKGEGRVFNQLRGGQAGWVGKLYVAPVAHERERRICSPVMSGLQEWHRKMAKPKCAAADVKKVIVRGHPRVGQHGHLGARRFPPTAADDITVAAFGDCLVIKAGD
jgi:hypothetical protein